MCIICEHTYVRPGFPGVLTGFFRDVPIPIFLAAVVVLELGFEGDTTVTTN